MALTEITYTGDGSDVTFGPIPFPYLEDSDVLITINGVATTAFTIDPSTKIITFSSAPANGTVIKVYRNTNNDTLAATFISGSAIRAVDLNDNFTQNLYVIQEIGNNAVQTDGSNPMVGDLNMGGYKIINLQSNPTADTDAANKHYVDTKVGASGPPGYTNWSYTATGGETVVGTFGSLLEYQVGKEQVYLNGALQQRNVDYTANDGNTVTFTVALTAADIVMVRCVNYLAADPTASYSFTRWRKTYNTLPTPATLIAGNSDAPEVALNYTINREQVFINGALLQRGVDYTPNNATSITLLSGPLTTGDVVEVHSNNSI
jgi:predicted secreted protein